MSIAVLSQPLPPAGFKEFRILPDGVFRANDGRPEKLDGWVMNGDIAKPIIASLAARDDVLIDYEHQSLKAATNGKPVPAAGWFKRAEWREGLGLFAVDVRWSAMARAMILNKEYRFISPAFHFDANTGEVRGILSVGLTNAPALTGLTDLAAASAMQPVAKAGVRATDRTIEAFNKCFGAAGIFHPETPPEMLAALKAQFSQEPEARPVSELAHLPPEDAAKLQHLLPGAWERPLEAKPTLPAGMNPEDAAKLRHAFPGVWD